MIRWLRISVLLLLGLSLLPFFGCKGGGTPQPEMQLTDQVGRTVGLVKSPQKIVCLDPSSTEIVYALGLADKIVAVSDETDYPEEAKKKSAVGSVGSIDTKRSSGWRPTWCWRTRSTWKRWSRRWRRPASAYWC